MEREAAPYDEKAVLENKKKQNVPMHGGCPGSRMRRIAQAPASLVPDQTPAVSQLSQWPCQIQPGSGERSVFRGSQAVDRGGLQRVCLRPDA